MDLRVIVEYVWIGGSDSHNTSKHIHYLKPYTLRSKTRIIYVDKQRDHLNINDIPIWNYDGSSTGQAETNKSEIFIFPRALFKNPFIQGGILVLCDTYLDCHGKIPHSTNTRVSAVEIFNQYIDQQPWFGIEQEFFLISRDTGLPVGLDPTIPQGQYYCSVGSNNAFGRELIDQIAQYALQAGILLSGWNAEVAPSQWEFQVGPLLGIIAGDHLWMLRYIMERATEGTPYYCELHPKPIRLMGQWNGSGCHTNYSTKRMRQSDGLDTINDAIKKLSMVHMEHIKEYGQFNELRLSGTCETSSLDHFSYGVSDRTASIRIPSEVFENKHGYLEDRRPSSLMDPYKVTSLLVKTTCS